MWFYLLQNFCYNWMNTSCPIIFTYFSWKNSIVVGINVKSRTSEYPTENLFILGKGLHFHGVIK